MPRTTAIFRSRGRICEPVDTKTRDFLRAVSLFSGLDDHDLDAIVAHAPIRAYRKNTVILDKGDDTSSLYMIISGRVKVYVSDGASREIVLSECGPGEHFGELALLNDLPRTASAITLEGSRLLVLSKSEFLNCLSRHPEVALNLIGSLVARVSALTDSLSDLALLDIYGRVKQILRKHTVFKDGVQVVEHFSQQDIASRVGSSRAMVSRIFKDLKAGGYISVKGKQITILKSLPAKW